MSRERKWSAAAPVQVPWFNSLSGRRNGPSSAPRNLASRRTTSYPAVKRSAHTLKSTPVIDIAGNGTDSRGLNGRPLPAQDSSSFEAGLPLVQQKCTVAGVTDKDV